MKNIIKNNIVIPLMIFSLMLAGLISVFFVNIDIGTAFNIEDDTKTVQYTAEKGFAVTKNGYIYFSDPSDSGRIYRVNSDGTSMTKLCDDTTSSLILYGGYIYYINKSDGKIYRILQDGTKRQMIAGDSAEELNISEDTIYYKNISKDKVIYACSLDGSKNRRINGEVSSFINVEGGYIFYRNADHKIVKMKIDGSERKVISDDLATYIAVSGSRIFFSMEHENESLYSIDLEGGDKTKLSDAGAYYTVVKDGWVYFVNLYTPNEDLYQTCVYKVRTNGEDLTRVTSDGSNGFSVSGNTIFYKLPYEGDRIYTVKTNGTGRRALYGVNYVYSVDQICDAVKSKTSFKIDDDELNKAYEKAQQIVKENIKPEMTDLQKEITIHDYIVKNTRYDYELTDNLKTRNTIINVESHDAYSLLVKGIGVCDAHADSFKLLMTLSGVECEVVTGTAGDDKDKRDLFNGHVWNVVKIGGLYYGVDVTWDNNIEDDSSMISYEYFNIPDSLMSQDHKWKNAEYPVAVSNRFEYLYNIGLASRDGDVIYYSNFDDNYKLYCMRIDGSENRRINNHKSYFMVPTGGWIYYSNYADGGSLYRVSVDGKNDVKLNDEWSINIEVKDGRVEYTNGDNQARYRIRTDGTGREKVN